MTYLISTKGTLENLVLLSVRAAKGDEGRELSPEEVSGGRVDAMPEGLDADAREKKEKCLIIYVMFTFQILLLFMLRYVYLQIWLQTLAFLSMQVFFTPLS